ncbi:MAG TPA: HAMP domain-containing protein [Planctomycetes bacterium]|nr:HAMP domain-containing protein [Planctomycetota bacterium]
MLIRTRIRLLLMVLLVTSLGGGIAAVLVINDLQAAMNESHRSRASLVATGEIRDLLLASTGDIEQLPTWQKSDRDRFKKRIARCQQVIQSMGDSATPLPADEREAILELEIPIKNFGRAVTRAFQYLEEGLEEKALNRSRNWLKDHLVPDIGSAVRSLEEIQQKRIVITETRARSASELITRVLVILGIVLLVSCLAFFVLLKRWIVIPIERLSVAAQEISQGHYGMKVPITSRDELGSLARDVESMSEAIEKYQLQLVDRERLAAVGEMTASVAHNLRNPLASIRALAQSCLRNDDQEATLLSLRQVMETVDRADRWLKELLQGLKPIQLEKIDTELASHLEAVADAVRPFSDKLQVQLQVEITEDLPRMKIDFRRIEQVVLVLLNNAIEASEAGNIVQLKSFRRSSEVFIEVIDEGHGMSEEITSRLFTPYFTTKKSGMGLGLSLAQRIIHGHGGRIDVVSSCGNGTRMSVMLPISEADPTSRV